jgi:hypothetical protein
MKKLLIAYIVLSAGLILYLLFEVQRMKQPGVIRARGIIVEDSVGRDRILIGAPFPESKDRVRTDTAKVNKYWGSRFEGTEYMKWYSSYHNGGNGIVVMNEAGFDKVLLGDELPDPNTGQRNGTPTGLLWNDEQGFERGGLGLNRLKSNNKYRNVLGFDDETGEALHVGLLEDGSKFIRFAWTDSVLLVGRGTAGNFLFNSRKPFVGLQFTSAKDSIGYRQNFIKK